jgi:bud site selection protein 20
MGNAPGKRKVGGNSTTRKWHKQLLRGKFEERHIDQVWQDVRKPPQLVHNGKSGPIGTTAT